MHAKSARPRSARKGASARAVWVSRAASVCSVVTIREASTIGSLAVAGAALNPQDNTATDNGVSPSSAVDLGAGNRSRVPNFEGRVSGSYRSGGKTVVGVDAWAGWQKNRFVSPATDTNVDVNSYIFGGDMTLNVWMVNVLGSIYSAKGWDQPGSLGASQGIALSVSRPSASSWKGSSHAIAAALRKQ